LTSINAATRSFGYSWEMEHLVQGHYCLFIVDDDPDVLAALKFTFEADGYEVVALTSGEALLSDPPRHDHACIIIDQRLPGLTGIEALVLLRDSGVATPAILITTHPSRSVVRRASELSVAIVEKPLIGEALTKQVTELTGCG
jgi:two-component system, LuxR family, response regulator FixJ